MNQFGHELRPTRRLRIPDRPEPIQHRVTVRVGIVVALVMRIEAFAGNQVRNSIAVDIREGRLSVSNFIPGTTGSKIRQGSTEFGMCKA